MVISKDNLPSGDYRYYRKTPLTRMLRMDDSFTVQTDEGIMTCHDGYLAIDSRGFPYPINADEHAAIYEEVSEDEL